MLVDHQPHVGVRLPQGAHHRQQGVATAVATRCSRWSGTLREPHPDVRLLIHEHEPAECLALLASDDIDLALTYDYNLAPGDLRPEPRVAVPLWATAWSLGVPAGRRRSGGRRAGGVRPVTATTTGS